MPRKIRELEADYLRAGFQRIKGGKGSHRKFVHPLVSETFILSGNDGEDADPYKERDLRTALRKLAEARKGKP